MHVLMGHSVHTAQLIEGAQVRATTKVLNSQSHMTALSSFYFLWLLYTFKHSSSSDPLPTARIPLPADLLLSAGVYELNIHISPIASHTRKG